MPPSPSERPSAIRTSRDILQGDFLKFIWFVWTVILSLPIPTRIQYDIARYLASGPTKRFIQAFRGIGKTFLTAAYVVWRLWKNPQLKVAVVSANEKLAVEIATFIKQIIDHPAGNDLWPELRTKVGQRSSAMAFDVGTATETPDKSPSVKAMGIFGQLTGSRADILISDDVEVPKNAETEVMREKLDRLTGEYAAIVKTTDEAETIYLGTPQTQESVYRGLEAKGYDIRIWPSRYPLATKLAAYGNHLAPLLVADIEADPTLCTPRGSDLGGAPTDSRFTEQQLMSREMELRRSAFLLQMMLDTSLSDADKFPLKTRDLIVMDVDRSVAPLKVVWGSGPDQVMKEVANVGFDGDRLCRPIFSSPDYQDFTGSVMIIDPSGRGKDETSYAVTKFLNGQVYLRRWGGFTDGFSETTLTALAKISADEEVNLIRCEDNMGDGMFRSLLEPYVTRLRPCVVEGYKVTGQKERRILAVLEPALAQHRVVIDRRVMEADLRHPEQSRRGLYQLTHLTSQRGSLRHDDRVEVLSEAVGYWAPRMNADQLKAVEAWEKKHNDAWDKEVSNGLILGAARRPKPLARGSGRLASRALKGVSW